jgi:hypothetical protein
MSLTCTNNEHGHGDSFGFHCDLGQIELKLVWRIYLLRMRGWDFVMDESGAGAGFLRELRFSCQSTFHLLLQIIFTITRGQEWPQCQ